MRIQDIPYLPTYGSQIGYIRPIGRSKTVRVASRGAAPFGLPPQRITGQVAMPLKAVMLREKPCGFSMKIFTS